MRTVPLHLLLRDAGARAAAATAARRFLIPDLDAATALDRARASTADPLLTVDDEPVVRLSESRAKVQLRRYRSDSEGSDSSAGGSESLELEVWCGDMNGASQQQPQQPQQTFIATPYHRSMLASMLLDHAVGRHLLLVRI